MRKENGACRKLTLLALAVLFGWLTSPLYADQPYSPLWSCQFGTDNYDSANDVAVDASGDVYIAGGTLGSMDRANAGGSDSYLAKITQAQGVLWTRQTGTQWTESSEGVAIGVSGHVFVTGDAMKPLANYPCCAQSDISVASYSESGSWLWEGQTGGSEADWPNGVASGPDGSVYSAGSRIINSTQYGFVVKFDAAGSLSWMQSFGTPGAQAVHSVAVDGNGDILVSGDTLGALGGENVGGYDAYVRKYNSNGDVLWTRQVGSNKNDSGTSVGFDAEGNVYLAGQTYGQIAAPNDGWLSPFICKFDKDGNPVWSRQIEPTDQNTQCLDVVIDAAGNSYLTGNTLSLFDDPHGSADIYLCSFDKDGEFRWGLQEGTDKSDYASSIAMDQLGRIYICGTTYGTLSGQSQGLGDAFVLVYVPEPATLSLLFLGGLAVLRRRRRG